MHKLVPISYFMNDMEQWEMSELIAYLPFSEMGAWNRMRLCCHLLLQTQVKRGTLKSPTDLFKLPWDVDQAAEMKKQLKTTITEEEVARLNEEGKRLNEFFSSNNPNIQKIPVTYTNGK